MPAFVAQIHIFADRHFRNQCQLLMDNDDAQFFRIFNIGKLTDLPVIDNIPFICSVGIYPAQHIHQGRFPRTVFSDQRVNLSFLHLEVYVIKCFYAREGLCNILHFQQNLSHGFLFPSGNDAGERRPPAS